MYTHARTTRTTRLAAFGAATALAAGGVVAAAPAAEAAKPASLRSSYTCTTALGDQTLDVSIKIDLPAKAKKGSKVADRPVNMVVKLPESLVSPMRDVLGITAISGSASKIKYAVGATKVPLSKVKIARSNVPDSGGMTLKAKGIANGFKAPKKPGSYVVSIPKAFTFNALNQDGQPVPTSPFPCAVADGAPTKLGTLKVTK